MAEKDLYENIYKKRFSFGKNWSVYLKTLNDQKIGIAKESLSKFTKLKDFNDKIFVDIGCGSGLFSLCAVKLGAKKVYSIDIDDNSINCAKYLRDKYKISKDTWIIKKGSALDKKFITEELPKADILYSWGVLHHTGNMYEAFENILNLVKKDTIFYLAIYNDFKGLPLSSKNWVKVKKLYSKNGFLTRKIIETIYTPVIVLGLTVSGKNPIKYIRNYHKTSLRGMSFYRDIVDWLGGYPFEYASPKEIEEYFKTKNMNLINKNLTSREGCNEFLLKVK